ncbi:MAG: cbb3-type cytochrome oxidase assembly protein CcoS [Pseudomonadota bacterium]
MESMLYLVPIALMLGILALCGFFWALNNNQFDDPKGNAERILRDD